MQSRTFIRSHYQLKEFSAKTCRWVLLCSSNWIQVILAAGHLKTWISVDLNLATALQIGRFPSISLQFARNIRLEWLRTHPTLAQLGCFGKSGSLFTPSFLLFFPLLGSKDSQLWGQSAVVHAMSHAVSENLKWLKAQRWDIVDIVEIVSFILVSWQCLWVFLSDFDLQQRFAIASPSGPRVHLSQVYDLSLTWHAMLQS